MEVIRGLLNLREHHRGSVVTIGNFDGVHTGHQAILAKVKEKANELGVPAMLICFEPQPQEYFDVYNAPARLTRFREKVELLAEHGIDYVLCVKFDEKARSMTAARFISVLVEDIGLSALYVGDDFKFGFDRSGDFSHLAAAAAEHGFPITDLYTMVFGSTRISSTRIRECLADGDFELAEKLLGHPYSITGKVVYGRQVGRTLGSPTVNIQLHRYVAPIAGVFAVTIVIGHETFEGVANVGVRPTFDEDMPRPILEVHIFDFDRDIYGSTVMVTFRQKIREEKKFDGIDALKTAIHADIKQAKHFFSCSS